MKKNFKIGLFGINSSGGLSLTRSKERWMADWKEIIKLVKYADQNKFDFILEDDTLSITIPNGNYNINTFRTQLYDLFFNLNYGPSNTNHKH